MYSRLVRTPSTVFAVGLVQSKRGWTLHVEALSASTGEVLASADILSNIHNALTDFLALFDSADESTLPHVVWLEDETLKSIALTPTLREKPKSIRGEKFAKLLNVGLNERGHFVALKSDGSAQVMKLDNVHCATLIWEFDDSVSSPYMVFHCVVLT